MDHISRLREVASWYRAQAERAETPAIREDQRRTAEFLEREAAFIERALLGPATEPRASCGGF